MSAIDSTVTTIPSQLVALLVAVAVAILVFVGRLYIKGAVEAIFTRRMSDEQHERSRELEAYRQVLSKDLESHRQALALSAEMIRSQQQRALEDYTIYAVRRHEAIADVYRNLLQATDIVEDSAKYAPRHSTEILGLARVEEILATVGATDRETDDIRAQWRDPDGGYGRTLLNETLKAVGRRLAITARNDAYNAVYRNALYLSPEVEDACRHVLEALHMFVVLRLVTEAPSTEWLKRREQLDSALEEAKRFIRVDVSRAATDNQVPPLLAGVPASV